MSEVYLFITFNTEVRVCLQPDQLNLLEDGLQLWLVALRNAPSPHSGLLSLFPNLAVVMQQSTGWLPKLCRMLT